MARPVEPGLLEVIRDLLELMTTADEDCWFCATELLEKAVKKHQNLNDQAKQVLKKKWPDRAVPWEMEWRG
jgi:hypothetical protein